MLTLPLGTIIFRIAAMDLLLLQTTKFRYFEKGMYSVVLKLSVAVHSSFTGMSVNCVSATSQLHADMAKNRNF